MLHNTRAIRALAVAIIRNEKGEVLVSPGYDRLKDEHFYRLLGGGIEFGESSLEALKREFQEEIGAELINCRLLKVGENIFSFEGEQGHEIYFLYEAEFADSDKYHQASFTILDSKEEEKVIWLDLKDKGNRNIYPDALDCL